MVHQEELCRKKLLEVLVQPEIDEDVIAQESVALEEKLAAERLRNLKSINSTIPGTSKIPTINTTGMVEDSMPTMKSISTFDSKLPSSGVDLTKRTDTTSNGDPAVTDTPTGSGYRDWETDRKSTRLNSSHSAKSRMPSSA